MNPKEIASMNTRDFAIAVLKKAGFQSVSYERGEVKMPYEYLELSSGMAAFRIKGYGSIRCLAMRGKSCYEDWFDGFKNAKENINSKKKLDSYIEALRKLGEK